MRCLGATPQRRQTLGAVPFLSCLQAPVSSRQLQGTPNTRAPCIQAPHACREGQVNTRKDRADYGSAETHSSDTHTQKSKTELPVPEARDTSHWRQVDRAGQELCPVSLL